MKRINAIIESNTQPRGNNTLWIKPKDGGGKELKLGNDTIGSADGNTVEGLVRIVFRIPDRDLNAYLYYPSNGTTFTWGFDNFDDYKALFQSFSTLQNILVLDNSFHERRFTLGDTSQNDSSLDKVFNYIYVGDVGSGDDSEPAILEYKIRITVFTDTNNKIDITRTLAEGRVEGSVRVAKGIRY